MALTSNPERRLARETFNAERKVFTVEARENHGGQMVRITENAGGHRDTIILPATGIDDMIAALQRVKASL